MGLKRRANEDSALQLCDYGVFCVADGMGGGQAGDQASKAVVDAIRSRFKTSEPARRTLDEKALDTNAAVAEAHSWIKRFAEERDFASMGSTVVAALLDERTPAEARILHAGDSRCYRLRQGQLAQLTTDHSIQGELGPHYRVAKRYRHALTRAVGVGDDLGLEQKRIDIRENDLLLLCTDGLTTMLNDDQIAQVMRREGPDVTRMAQVLVDEANRKGGFDNTTVLLLAIGHAGATLDAATPVTDAVLDGPPTPEAQPPPPDRDAKGKTPDTRNSDDNSCINPSPTTGARRPQRGMKTTFAMVVSIAVALSIALVVQRRDAGPTLSVLEQEASVATTGEQIEAPHPHALAKDVEAPFTETDGGQSATPVKPSHEEVIISVPAYSGPVVSIYPKSESDAVNASGGETAEEPTGSQEVLSPSVISVQATVADEAPRPEVDSRTRPPIEEFSDRDATFLASGHVEPEDSAPASSPVSEVADQVMPSSTMEAIMEPASKTETRSADESELRADARNRYTAALASGGWGDTASWLPTNRLADASLLDSHQTANADAWICFWRELASTPSKMSECMVLVSNVLINLLPPSSSSILDSLSAFDAEPERAPGNVCRLLQETQASVLALVSNRQAVHAPMLSAIGPNPFASLSNLMCVGGCLLSVDWPAVSRSAATVSRVAGRVDDWVVMARSAVGPWILAHYPPRDDLDSLDAGVPVLAEAALSRAVATALPRALAELNRKVAPVPPVDLNEVARMQQRIRLLTAGRQTGQPMPPDLLDALRELIQYVNKTVDSANTEASEKQPRQTR
ncbi:MAG: protein phosphatase 2C domain-containing protein [Lentisphaerae bacterium]|nr:protein phosphatase 2C domain-containing protein [Lentisphaerota bacterium]